MKIKRTDKRIVVCGQHPYFAENKELWIKLRNGDTIDVPKDEYDTIKEIFGDSIQLASLSKPAATLADKMPSKSRAEDKEDE